MGEHKKCKNCLKGKSISINGDYICPHNGIVSPDYSCNKHRYITSDHIKMSLLKCCDCISFSMVEETSTGPLGTCHMFTIRLFNGNERRACSRITTTKSLA